MIDAKFLRNLQPARDGIEPDDATRSTRLCHRRPVQAQQAETLDDDRVTQADLGCLRNRGHGRNTAIEGCCLLVAEIIGKLQNPGARKNVAILGKSAEEMRILLREIVAVFAHAMTLLRHVEDFAVIALPIEEIFAPGDAVAYLERIAAHVFFDALTDLLDSVDDFVAENSRTWIRSASLIGMNVRTTDRRHRYPHQDLASPGRTHGKLLQNERRIWRLVYSGLPGTHCPVHSRS